jgi:alkylation response protein AidB-like acyl-CoA dehydrogenase
MITSVPEHPSQRMDADVVALLRRYNEAAEGLGHLHAEQLKVLYDNGWFKFFVPEAYGGLGLSLPQGVRLEESMAWIDGSLGWVVTLCSGASWFVGFLEEALSRQLLADRQVCFAGSGAPTGTAEIVEGGYRINGDWLYASGSHHATVFTANCVIHEHGVARLDAAGAPEVRPFVFLRDEVTLSPAWKAIGMIATASHAFAVKELFVPAIRCFRIDGRYATLTDAIYQYPFLPLAETTLAANLAGMAVRFIDLCDVLFSERPRYSRSHTQEQGVLLTEKLREARLALDACRSGFYDVLDRSWAQCVDGRMSNAVLEEVGQVSRRLARTSLEVVDKLYPFAGLRAADPETEINRVWRNLHTASQHALLVF